MTVHLRTDRLRLRRLTPDDLDNLVELDSDPQVMRYLSGGRPTPRDQVGEILPRLLAYYERGDDVGYWAVEDLAAARFLGWVFLRPHRGDGPPASVDRSGLELGYRLRRDAWGRGYATEVCRALLTHSFAATAVERIFAETMVVNTASRHVMEKSGLRHVATFHPAWPDPIPGDEQGEVQYAVTAAEWGTAA